VTESCRHSLAFSCPPFSRTRDFADDFAKSLSAFDEIILLDIYPARSGINSQWLMDKMINTNKTSSS
jgi:UDP-N-acetylmuramate--alanine ligase